MFTEYKLVTNLLEGLLKKLMKKGKEEPKSEEDALEIAQRMEKRLKHAWEKDPEARKYLKAQGYSPKEEYNLGELHVFTTYLGVYTIQKSKKKDSKNAASYA